MKRGHIARERELEARLEARLKKGMCYGGAAIIGGAALVGGMMSADAAESAAATQAQAAGDASALNAQVTRESIAEQRRQYEQTRADTEPFRKLGVDAIPKVRQIYGIDSNAPFVSLADLQGDAILNFGKDFAVQQGRDAITNIANARGEGDSGNTLKTITQFAEGLMSGRAADVFGRKLALAGGLSTLTGQGSGATLALGQIGASTSGNISQLLAQMGQFGGNAIMSAGNAQAAGIVGGANAWTNALAQVSSAYQQQQLLNRFLGPGGGSTVPWSGTPTTPMNYAPQATQPIQTASWNYGYTPTYFS